MTTRTLKQRGTNNRSPLSKIMPLNKLIRKLSKWNYQQGDDCDMRAFTIGELKKINKNFVIINAFENKKVITNAQEYLNRKKHEKENNSK